MGSKSIITLKCCFNCTLSQELREEDGTEFVLDSEARARIVIIHLDNACYSTSMSTAKQWPLYDHRIGSPAEIGNLPE